jgi:glycosyltransferase involved in cell wall biosynthesis
MQFHILSFEGPDGYARAGGLASRVEGLAQTLAELGHETHLWYVGDPNLPGHEQHGCLTLHRWCQWVSHYHPAGVYDGEDGKHADYCASLPPFIVDQYIRPYVEAGGHSVVLAEEWHTVDAVLHLDWLLRDAGLRDRANLLWNANNTYGFERIPWDQLARAARITTVSRYMKHKMADLPVDALVIPNGLAPDCFASPERRAVAQMRQRFKGRTVLAKMARFDPDKRWLASIDIVSELKREGRRPLLLARGGSEGHGAEVLRSAHAHGLHVVDRTWSKPGAAGLLEAIADVGDADMVHLHSFVDPDARRVMFRASDVVLANSGHEPFGLVGLEAMAAGGIACTGCSGEDYAVPGQNAIVLETSDPREFVSLYRNLCEQPERAYRMRRAGKQTAQRYSWEQVAEAVLLPRVEIGLPPRPRALDAAAADRAVAPAADSPATGTPVPPLGPPSSRTRSVAA